MDEDVLRTIRQAGVTVDEAMDRLADLKRKPVAAPASVEVMEGEAASPARNADVESPSPPGTDTDADPPSPPETVGKGTEGGDSAAETGAVQCAATARAEDVPAVPGSPCPDADVRRDEVAIAARDVDTSSTGETAVGDVVEPPVDVVLGTDVPSDSATESGDADGATRAAGGDVRASSTTPILQRAEERRLDEMARALRRETEMLMRMLDRADSMPRITVAVADELARRTESVGRLTSDIERVRRSLTA